MPKRQSVPSYCLHKTSGQARVIVDGKHIYLGKYQSKESLKLYSEVLDRLSHQSEDTGSDQLERTCEPFPEITVDELLAAYFDFAVTYYSSNGEPTKEFVCMREAARHIRQRYGSSIVSDFGPRKLKQVREDMITNELARTVINNRINRIRRIFKWGVSEELVPSSILEALKSVDGLRYGRCNAKETKPVKPVADSDIECVVTTASPQIEAMIHLQRLTGMRPGEVVIVRLCDIDQTEEVWIYSPYTHKNKHRGYDRQIPLGPRCQEILKPFLDRSENAFVFSPLEAEAWRSQQRRKARKSPLTPSQRNRKPKSNPKREKHERYDTASYRRAIKYAIEKYNRENPKSKISPWHPHQLRHQYATVVRMTMGAEAVQIGLGHRSTNLVDLYAEKNLQAAKEMAKACG